MITRRAFIQGAAGLAAATRVAGASSPVDDFTALLNASGRRKLAAAAGPPEKLRADGYEFAHVFLKSLTQERLVKNQTPGEGGTGTLEERTEEVMRNRISLLGGYPVQDLGFPYDWFRAPQEDWQWPTHLARHAYLMPLALMYQASGEERYAQRLADVLVDWVHKFPLGGAGLKWTWKTRPGAGAQASGEGLFLTYVDGPWTALSAHARVQTWLGLLALIADARAMNNQTTALLLSSLLTDHRQVMLDFPRTGTANQFLSVGTALIRLGLWLPDFECAEECRREGIRRVAQFATEDVYPDGSVAECSPNYGLGSVRGVLETKKELEEHGYTAPAILGERVRAAAHYYATIADPLGRSPRIAKGGDSIRAALHELNQSVADAEVAWVASGGTEGKRPAQLNYGYNWAGHFVMRSGWEPNDTWMFFEPGPRGAGHHDKAQLSLQLVSHGIALLTDPGYYSYSSVGEEGRMANYLASTFAHNTAIVDGMGQRSFPTGKGRAPNSAAGEYHWSDGPERCSAEGAYTYGYGEAGEIAVVHHRRISLLKLSKMFLVEDQFTGEGSHKYEILWQAPPDAQVAVKGRSVSVSTQRAQATLEFESSESLSVTTLSGSREPMGGWYSEHYGELAPANTIYVTSSGRETTVTTRIRVTER